MAPIFKYRNGWRAQVCVGERKATRDFECKRDARQWTNEQAVREDANKTPRLGGPTQCTVAAMLDERARTYSIALDGRKAEFNRINHYLRGAGMPLLKPVEVEGRWHVVETDAKAVDAKVADGWQKHLHDRREKRTRTYEAIGNLGKRRVGTVLKGDIQDLMTVMRADGLSESTIQKEIAMLKAAFNIAIEQWHWVNLKNPCEGLKLGKSTPRFVRVAKEELEALYRACGECDNPYFLALVDCAIFLTARQGSLLTLRWEEISFEGRNVYLRKTKTGPTLVPLPSRCAIVLGNLPRHPSGFVFPMTDNAVNMAWEGVRAKAGLKRLQFRDLRHLGGTHYARRVPNAHMLRQILGHKTVHQAEVYINLANQDVVDVLDQTEPDPSTLPPLPMSAGESMAERRSKRLNVRPASAEQGTFDAPRVAPAKGNVIPFPRASKAQDTRTAEGHSGLGN